MYIYINVVVQRMAVESRTVSVECERGAEGLYPAHEPLW